MKARAVRPVHFLLFLLCVGLRPMTLCGAQDDVWDPHLVDRDEEGVTIEFKYRLASRNRSPNAHVLAYPLPRFAGVEWGLAAMRPGRGIARIRMLCRNAPAPPKQTDRVHIYMNDNGKVFFAKDLDLPIRWSCPRRGLDSQRGTEPERSGSGCPSFKVSFRNIQLDSTTAHRPAEEFPVDWVTVALVVSNVGKLDTGRELVLRTELAAGGNSARGSIPADGVILRLSHVRAGEQVPFKFRDAFYHGEERRYRAFMAPSPDLSDSQARQIKRCLETNHATLRVDESKLHDARGRPATLRRTMPRID